MKNISKNSDDICKLLAFQGIFEILSEIMVNEDTIIVKDCAELLKILMNVFNKNYIRECPELLKAVSHLILSEYKESILEFVITACSHDNNSIFVQNQQFFAGLTFKVMQVAFPVKGNQSKTALKLLSILLKNNPTSVLPLFEADSVDVLDSLLTYCTMENNHNINIEILCSIISSNSQICENFISRITCNPNFSESNELLPSFNQTLIRIVSEKSSKLPLLCKTLELILHSNESSKQLAVHLPIDISYSTLLHKVFFLWIDFISLGHENILQVSRLLIVWIYESVETAQKIEANLYNYLPQILAFLEKKNNEVSQCFVSIVVGLICLYSKSKEISNLLLKGVGYSEICLKLEHLLSVSEFSKLNENSALNHFLFSLPLTKVYKNAVQAIKMHFLKEITESAPNDQKELAKLLEAQEAVISMHYLKKGNQSDSDSNEIILKNKELEALLQTKNEEIFRLEGEISKIKHEKNKEIRGIMQNLIGLLEKNDLVEFENISIQRENKNLNAKIERLLEEIKTYSLKKHDFHNEIKLIEAKEGLKIQENEIKYLKNIIQRKEKEYQEAVEIIGKQETVLRKVDLKVIENENLVEDYDENQKELRKNFEPILEKTFSCNIFPVYDRNLTKNEAPFDRQEEKIEEKSTEKETSENFTQTIIEENEVIIHPYQKIEEPPNVNWFGEIQEDKKSAFSFFDHLPQGKSPNSFF